MKQKIALVLAASTLGASVLGGCGNATPPSQGGPSNAGGSSSNVVNVYNWGEYIDMSVLEDFEQETGIKVNYQTFESNEALYGKLVGGGGGYDVIIPSDLYDRPAH